MAAVINAQIAAGRGEVTIVAIRGISDSERNERKKVEGK